MSIIYTFNGKKIKLVIRDLSKVADVISELIIAKATFIKIREVWDDWIFKCLKWRDSGRNVVSIGN